MGKPQDRYIWICVGDHIAAGEQLLRNALEVREVESAPDIDAELIERAPVHPLDHPAPALG